MQRQDNSDTVFDRVLDIVRDVKRAFGSCFDGSIYVKAIEVGCRLQNIKTETKREHYLRYKDEFVGFYVFDIVAEGSVAVLVECNNDTEDDDEFWRCCLTAKLDGINMNGRYNGKIDIQRYEVKG